jgi:hypothetical protein
MKTLNDYIRESILDDEDELIGRAKYAFNDPFHTIQHLCDNYSYKEFKHKIDYIDEILKPIKDKFMKHPKIKKNGIYIETRGPIMGRAYSVLLYTYVDNLRIDKTYLMYFDFVPQSKDNVRCYRNKSEVQRWGFSRVIDDVEKFLTDKYNFKKDIFDELNLKIR